MQKQIARQLGINQERVQYIVQTLSYCQNSARWIPQQLADVLEEQRKKICQELLNQYRREGAAFLINITNGDEQTLDSSLYPRKQASANGTS